MTKHDVIKKYNLPAEVKFCKRCTISNQRPRISFDENGICSACNFSDYKRSVDWMERERELSDLMDQHRRNDGRFDVIVPCSGGKDGSYVAHQLKREYNMNPLCVSWSPNIATEIGRVNLQNFIDAGFNHIMGTPDGLVNRKLVRLALLHVGDPFLPFIYGQQNFPMQMSVRYDVPLIMYGENGEVEYGGDMKNAYRPTRKIDDHDKHYFSGLSLEIWQEHGLNAVDLFMYQAPDYDQIEKNKTDIHFYSYYKFWDPQENYYYSKEHTNFSANSERSEGTFSKYASLDDKLDGFHYYLSAIKFGVGRCTSDTAHEIRDGKITREEGIALVKRYDGEFPQKYLKNLMEYCDITEDQVIEWIDSWRSDHIWATHRNGWKLRNPIWEENH